jgi:hypothetical protein
MTERIVGLSAARKSVKLTREKRHYHDLSRDPSAEAATLDNWRKGACSNRRGDMHWLREQLNKLTHLD